jgi:hypothetical protein
MPGEPEGVLPTPKARSSSGQHAPDERPIDTQPGDGQPGRVAEQIDIQPPLDELPAGGAGESTRIEEVVETTLEPIAGTEVAADPRLQCGTCVNMTASGWCRSRRFVVTPALPACVFHGPVMG